MAAYIYVRPIFSSVEPLDDNINAVEVADPTPDGGLPLNRTYAKHCGRAVLAETLPKRMQWASRGGAPMPDFDNGLILNVSERARDVIEGVEPGVHQFVPVDYFRPSGEELGRRFFLFAGNRVDGVHRASPGMMLLQGMMWIPARDRSPDERPADFDPNAEPAIFFDASRIEGYHMWIDKHLRMTEPVVSDEMAAAIADAGLTGVELPQAKVM